MKPPKPTTNNGIRPGFLFLLVCALAGTMGLLWLYRAKAPATESTAEVTTAVESSAVVEPAFAEPPAAEPAATDTAGPLEAKWGIQVAGLSLSRADSAVELRYVVTSPEKTASLADQKKEAYLIELVSGAKIPIATPSSEGVGRPHSRARSMALMMPGAGTFPPNPNRLTAGRSFSVLLPNPGGVVQKGSKVAFVIGDLRTDDLTVQ